MRHTVLDGSGNECVGDGFNVSVFFWPRATSNHSFYPRPLSFHGAQTYRASWQGQGWIQGSASRSHVAQEQHRRLPSSVSPTEIVWPDVCLLNTPPARSLATYIRDFPVACKAFSCCKSANPGKYISWFCKKFLDYHTYSRAALGREISFPAFLCQAANSRQVALGEILSSTQSSECGHACHPRCLITNAKLSCNWLEISSLMPV